MIKKVFLYTFLFFLALVLSVAYFALSRPRTQTNGGLTVKNTTSQKKTINLTIPKDSRRVVYETNKVIISFGLDEFKSNLEKFIKTNNVGDDKELLAYIEQQSKTSSKIRLDNVDVKLGLSKRIQYRVADMLESGSFTLYDKAGKVFVKSIIVETHGMNCGDLCGSGGRNFMFGSKNTIFFYTMDWIS